jgi:hypothetical protein
MTEPEPQRTLSGYKSQVHEGTDFENPNDGKAVLNDVDEYVFRLASFPRVKTFSQIKEKKDGTRVTVKIDKAICEFEEQTTKNQVLAFFRVDSLNFSEDESFESAIVRFFKKIKHPLPEGVSPNWDEYFVVGMRFRGRVVIGRGDDKKPNGKYFLDVPTVRPLLPQDKGDAPATSQDASATLANALLLAKGSKTHQEAMDKLQSAGAPKELVMALFQANLDNKITFPI